MKTWITADWHLGETRMKIIGRPFRDQNDNVEQLIAWHNSVVSPGDHVIVDGDVCYTETPSFLSEVARFNGTKVLLRGNHDRVFTDEDLAPYFEKVVAEGDGVEYLADGVRCHITHYPTRGSKDMFNLVGHVHAAWKYQLNCLNVGVDANHFLPVDMETIPFHLEAICRYYDDDVWVAYEELNTHFRYQRGKQGSYLRGRVA